jgi:hypothetical protein
MPTGYAVNGVGASMPPSAVPSGCRCCCRCFGRLESFQLEHFVALVQRKRELVNLHSPVLQDGVERKKKKAVV